MTNPRRPRPHVWAAVGLAAALSLAIGAEAGEFAGQWRPLYPTRGKSPLEPVDGLVIVGPHQGHPFYLGEHLVSGEWAVVDGRLCSDRAPALVLGEGTDFEVEGIADCSGTGGLFFLVGHDGDGGSGFGVWNATMRKSGSPWGVFEYTRGAAIAGESEDLDPFEWKGEQPFRLAVIGGAMTLQVGPRTVLDGRPLEGYEGGQVIFGAYGTRYGPREIRIRALRARAAKAE